jgi:hypothetical protein
MKARSVILSPAGLAGVAAIGITVVFRLLGGTGISSLTGCDYPYDPRAYAQNSCHGFLGD